MSYWLPRRTSHMVSFCWRGASGRVEIIAKANVAMHTMPSAHITPPYKLGSGSGGSKSRSGEGPAPDCVSGTSEVCIADSERTTIHTHPERM